VKVASGLLLCCCFAVLPLNSKLQYRNTATQKMILHEEGFQFSDKYPKQE